MVTFREELLLASVYRGEVPAEWDLFVKVVSREGLAPFFFHHLQLFSSGSVPVAFFEKLKQGFLIGVARHLGLEEITRRVLHALEEGGVPCLVLKGMALAYLVYPDPATRQMADIDLLIQSKNIRRALSLLETLGYRPARQYKTYQEEMIRFGSELALEGPEGPIVELHWGVDEYERLKGLIRLDEASIWQRAISYSLNGIEAKALCPEDQLLTLAIHFGFKHHFQGPKWLLDFDRLIRTFEPTLDGVAVMRKAREAGISSLFAHILWLCCRIFATPLPSGMEARPLWTARGISAQFWFLDRWGDRFRMLKRVFFPSNDWLRFRYRLEKGQSLWPARFAHPLRVLVHRLP